MKNPPSAYIQKLKSYLDTGGVSRKVRAPSHPTGPPLSLGARPGANGSPCPPVQATSAGVDAGAPGAGDFLKDQLHRVRRVSRGSLVSSGHCWGRDSCAGGFWLWGCQRGVEAGGGGWWPHPWDGFDGRVEGPGRQPAVPWLLQDLNPCSGSRAWGLCPLGVRTWGLRGTQLPRRGSTTQRCRVPSVSPPYWGPLGWRGRWGGRGGFVEPTNPCAPQLGPGVSQRGEQGAGRAAGVPRLRPVLRRVRPRCRWHPGCPFSPDTPPWLSGRWAGISLPLSSEGLGELGDPELQSSVSGGNQCPICPQPWGPQRSPRVCWHRGCCLLTSPCPHTAHQVRHGEH